MTSGILLAVYCVLILLASLAGGLIPLLVRLSHRQMEIAASLVAGVMLGVGLLHLLPHALIEARGAMDAVFLWVIFGFLAMFFIERFFCFHHHEVPDPDAGDAPGHACNHAASAGRSNAPHRMTWGGAAIGLSLHTAINGVALAAAVAAESHGGHAAALAGVGTFLVIFLHKPFDSMTIGALMSLGGRSPVARHAVNGLFALMVPLGVVLFQLGLTHAGEGSILVAAALAFSAGTFLCIATSDLLPELQFHRHDRVALSLALVLGLAAAWAIGLIEPGGPHHGHGPLPVSVEHKEP